MRSASALACVSISVALALPAHAQDFELSLRTCRALTDESQRLACYDAIPIGAGSDAPSAAKPALSAEQRFGLPAATVLQKEAERGAAPQEMATLNLKVTSLSFGANGRVVIGLENGQVWQQLMPGAELELLKLGDRVEISRGLLGSFWLAAPGRRGAKVTRVR